MGKIYCITNNFNNKKYIGQTTEKYLSSRLRKHRTASRSGVDTLFYRAMRKYGEYNFEIELLEIVEDNMLDIKETEWILKLNTKTPNGYNCNLGGVAMFGENNPFYGKEHSQETKDYISELAKSRIGDKNGFFNKTHTKLSKSKMSQSKKKYYNIKMYDDDNLINEFKDFKEAYNWIINNLETQSKKYSSITGNIIESIKRNKKSYGYIWTVEKDVETIESVSKDAVSRVE